MILTWISNDSPFRKCVVRAWEKYSTAVNIILKGKITGITQNDTSNMSYKVFFLNTGRFRHTCSVKYHFCQTISIPLLQFHKEIESLIASSTGHTYLK